MQDKLIVTDRGLAARVRRVLSRRGQRLVRRDGVVYVVHGPVARRCESLEALGREVGALAEHEAVAA